MILYINWSQNRKLKLYEGLEKIKGYCWLVSENRLGQVSSGLVRAGRLAGMFRLFFLGRQGNCGLALK